MTLEYASHRTLQLLLLLGIGFLQGLYALDAADEKVDHPREVSLASFSHD